MTSAQGLAERILPARGAAQKASASFAGQLTDSPGRSDIDSSSPSNPFREPAHRTKSVKYRYSATGKHLSSPLKGSASSPERKPASARQPKQTPSTPPRPRLPTAATTSRKRRLSPSSLRREDTLRSIFISPPSPLSSAPTSPTVSTKDLPPSPTPTFNDPLPVPPKRISVSNSLSLRSLPAASTFSVLSQPLSPRRKQRKHKANAEKGLGPWNIGNSVWILVSQSGVLADSQSHPDPSEPLMWWPAQVVQKQPLRVSMFGDFPSLSSTSRGLCTIFAPSPSNVQSIDDDSGAKRFSRATFRITSLSADHDASPPTKKPRLDETASVEAKWESAVQSMEKASTLEQDGLPALLSSYATTGDSFHGSLDDSDPDVSDLRQPGSSAPKRSKPPGSTRKLKPQRSRANVRDDATGSTSRSWSPCPPDPTLQIPGELVLALAPRTGGSYWPAQILAHVPDRKEKYRVKFLDDEEHVITRDRFWTSEEEGFAQCALGEWESTIKTIDDPESGDEDGVDDNVNTGDATSTLPPPPPAEDFEDLPARTQLAYVKPVLRAILNKEYPPAREKHEAFIRGGLARVALLKSAGIRGGMDARFVRAVQKAICKWVLGDSGIKPKRLVAGDIATETVEAEVEGETTVKPISSEVASAETLARDPVDDNKMVGIEGEVIPEAVHADKNDGTANGALLLTTPDKQVAVTEDAEMAVDGQEQQRVSLHPPAKGTGLSSVVTQASLAPKSQLDLLAEVSQAVATEPSLLPSHPELPRLKVDILNIPCKDASPQASPLTPIPDEDQQMLPETSVLVVCDEFETLSGIEKLDYCLNILLPECIQQLLLWRSGERTLSALLSPEEEQRLHYVGARKAAETDWVDDVMRLRAAQARLWGVGSNKTEEKKGEVSHGGTRSRPRRGTVSRP